MREVDEAVRQDQMGDAVKRYALPVGIAVVVGLAALGGWLYWHEHSEGVLEERSEGLVTGLDAIDAGRASQADAELAKLVADDAGGAAIPAMLLRADIALQNGKPADAVKLFDAVAANDSAPQPYRDIAAIRSVATNYDNLQPQQVIDRLKPLATPGNPWFGSAGELVGMAYLAQNKNDLAGPLFAEIAKNEKVPETLRSRARQLAGMLGYDAVVDVDKTLAELQEGAAAAPAAATAQ